MEAWINLAVIYIGVVYLFFYFTTRYPIKNTGLAILNIAFTYLCFFHSPDDGEKWLFAQYLLMVASFYFCLWVYGQYPMTATYTLALLAPIAGICLFKAGLFPTLLGFSYLSFRLSYLAYEVYTGKTKVPSFISYMGFAFFPLTFLIGPISPYHYYESSLQKPDRALTPLPRSLMRILVGMAKFFFISPLFKTMSFSGLWFDGYFHGISDFAVACVCSFLYFYFNFSGACDMIIGASGILNIRVKENFDNTLLSRNMRDFWNRTHITLSHFLRDILFTPGMIFLTRLLGVRYTPAITVLMLLVTFLAMGLWHGVAKNFLILGLLHGAGMVTYYLYSLLWMKMPARFQAFTQTLPMRIISTLLTLGYVSFTCLFLIHSWIEIQGIFLLFVW